ncbi:MAG: O-acetylserine/cysteine exporter [Firmicutes bacterium]|nr:O-acetylserine/cysteine exporter [Bacillota bacterium]
MRGRDIILGLIVVVLWGLNFIAIKTGLQNIPPLFLGSLRFIAATLPAIFFLPRPPIAWRRLISLGLTINVGQFTFLFLGMKLGMPAGLASLVIQAQAFFTLAFAALLLKEHWCWNHIAGLVLAACGMTIIGFVQEGGMTAIGFWLTLAAAASWGIGNIIMRKATQGVPPYSSLSLVVWAGSIAIPPLLFLSWNMEGPAAWHLAWQSSTWADAASVIYLAFFATLGGYALWGKLLSRYPAAIVSPFALLVPVVCIASSAFLLGETLSLWQVFGVSLVMAGLVIHVLGDRLRSKNRFHLKLTS